MTTVSRTGMTRPIQHPPVMTFPEGVFPASLPDHVDVLVAPPGLRLEDPELGEIQDLLYAGERHGAVCARTLQPGTWVSFPLQPPSCPLDRAAILKAHAELLNHLPRHAIVPAAPCAPILVKGELLKRFGGPPRGEPFDPFHITLRLSRYGYSTLVANRVLIQREPDQPAPCVTLADAFSKPTPIYPECAGLLEYYLDRQMHPMERFAELFAGPHRPRLLFNLLILRPNHNGTSEYGLSLLRELTLRFASDFDITVLASDAAAEFHRLRLDYTRVCSPETLDGVFDLGFMPSQIVDARFLSIMNRHCLRITFTLLDVIGVRSGYLLSRRPHSAEVLRTAVQFAEGITTLSHTGRADAKAYFGSLLERQGQVVRPIFPGVTLPAHPLPPLPDDLAPGYVLIVGNLCRHKAIHECVSALVSAPYRLVVLGDSSTGTLPPGVRHFPSGRIAPELVSALYGHCSVLVFPSQYEGFGLPAAHALSLGKPVVLFPIEINYEIVKHFSVRENQAVFCPSFPHLAESVGVALARTEPLRQASSCSWGQAAEELRDFLVEVSRMPVEGLRLEERHRLCQLHVAESKARLRSVPTRQVGVTQRIIERFMPRLMPWRTRCPYVYELFARPYRRYVLGCHEGGAGQCDGMTERGRTLMSQTIRRVQE